MPRKMEALEKAFRERDRKVVKEVSPPKVQYKSGWLQSQQIAARRDNSLSATSNYQHFAFSGSLFAALCS